MIKLLPCPFCGGKAKKGYNRVVQFWVTCNKCGATIDMRDKSAATIAWNTRADKIQPLIDTCKHLNDARHSDNATGRSFVPDRTDDAIDKVQHLVAIFQANRGE